MINYIKECTHKLLPLGNPEFTDIRDEKMIYVDKTSLIEKIAKYRTPIFFSRPRRFGKSLLVHTLETLFKSGLKYFSGLDIEKKWTDTTYKVIRIDFSRMASKNNHDLQKSLNDSLVKKFNLNTHIPLINELGMRSPDDILSEICELSPNNSIVLLIDEYDAPLTHHINKIDELEKITSTLSNFYATIKEYTGKFRFIFITGVTRVSHISIFSAFNNLKDISLSNEYNDLLGFTNDDLYKYFDNYIENASRVLKIPKNALYDRIEQYYDGYQFSLDSNKTLYNPWSILSFLDSPSAGFKNYWFKSAGSSTLIMQYIKAKNLNDLNYIKNDVYISEDKLSNRYDISNIPQTVLLYQTGYLSIRKKTDRKAQLVFPNTEVEDSILLLSLAAKNFEPDIENYSNINTLIENIDKKNTTYIINVFNSILNESVSYDSNIFQDERAVRDIIYAALPQKIDLMKFKERITSKERSDLEISTRKTRMIIEFKRTYPNRNAESSLQEAIKQMKNRNYSICAFHDLNLYRVAMVISTEDKVILSDFCSEVE